ncbi:MAG: hypothetical protein Q7T36_02355 [Fluviicoccus sp.]|uniref:tetratricopeptide repeat protein n=1 Tax=Fluviicoccus sp. TaxID=2003552 RepID=UPI00271DD992|nr:hypothetical protein [Fluviicoccus sp.]MDO8329294.1 hypothetical protein [Fluviicoccus sp.]
MASAFPASPDRSRLDRLLGYLDADPANPALLTDALQEAIAAENLDAGDRILSLAARANVTSTGFQAHALHFCLLKTDYEAAAAYGDSALAQGLHHPAVVFNTGFARFYLQRFADCAALMLPYCAANPAHAAAAVIAARALHHLDREEEALPLLEQALAAEPELPEALGVKALLLYELDRNAEALVCADMALAGDADQLDALLAKGEVLLEQDQPDYAAMILQHLVDKHPTCGRGWSDLAQCAFLAMDLPEVERCVRHGVEFMPEHIGSWHLLAWVHILKGETGQAREVLQRSYALDRNFAETHGGLAVVDAMEGLTAEAELGIRRALKLDAGCMSAQFARLLLLKQGGDAVGAEALVKEVLEQPFGESGETLFDLVVKQARLMSEGKTRH